ncbi:nicotinate-nicotinamide nucleotide adenylyltransferase [Marinicella gelatinilytica]|uniref:nicotinate-nicotinamide nucleotide adenylyltransferase n=1 Tax=Marinicella gelatinilytica TaxID=2996017 RepID=UPI002260CBC7|nr:nicotinate-nicotinamide nucleotide adenylyltransferase [Marinicella gelatinilytica]MCX7543892.1 nicotinate-nicotinamide nucleotide adenylyltransferase [Marinicella gelatinilytica]
MNNNQAITWVFGLTADPIHRGHEQVVKNTLAKSQELGLKTSEFILVPTYQPNLIADKSSPIATFEQRFEMCKLVAKELSQELETDITVNDIEQKIHNRQPSYTYDTLDALAKDHDNLILIISSDHAHGHAPKFRQWHRWDELINRFGLIIHERPGYPLNDCFVSYLKELNPNVYVAKNQANIDISSLRLRNAYAYGAEVSEAHINPAVDGYIKRFGLYS